METRLTDPSAARLSWVLRGVVGRRGGSEDPWLSVRTPRGRVLAEGGYRHLGLKPPKNMSQLELLSEEDGDG